MSGSECIQCAGCVDVLICRVPGALIGFGGAGEGVAEGGVILIAAAELLIDAEADPTDAVGMRRRIDVGDDVDFLFVAVGFEIEFTAEGNWFRFQRFQQYQRPSAAQVCGRQAQIAEQR